MYPRTVPLLEVVEWAWQVDIAAGSKSETGQILSAGAGPSQAVTA